MAKFVISTESSKVLYSESIMLDIDLPIADQLNRRRLELTEKDRGRIKQVINYNSSLRVSFGWAFEATYMFYNVMIDCVNEVHPKYNLTFGDMTSDYKCSWLGFVPYSMFEERYFEDLSAAEMIEYNNKFIEYQIDIVSFIANSKLFRQHALCRDSDYRYNYFKNVRQDPVKLADAINEYVDAMIDSCILSFVPNEVLERTIGAHCLWHPSVYFETIDYLTLKGNVK